MRCPSVANDCSEGVGLCTTGRIGDGTHAIKIRDRIIGRGGKCKIDICELREIGMKHTVSVHADGWMGDADAHQWFPRFPLKLLAQELDYGLKAVRDRHSEEVLFHYRRISDSFEAHDNCG